MSLPMSVTKPHGIASGVYLGLCYEATGSSTIAGYSANPQVSLTAHGTGAYYWDDALVEESAKKMTPAKFQPKA